MFKKSKAKIHQKKSYSQSGEDLIIKFVFDAIGIKQPSYLDLGAHSPHYLNNTAIFYELGSSGINVEADPSLISEFTKIRKRDINLNLGVGTKNEIKDFYIMNVPTLNTFCKKTAMGYSNKGEYSIVNSVPVEIMTVDDIIAQYLNGESPDLLSVDVEGLDDEIIKSINFELYKPTIICVETLEFDTKGMMNKNNSIEDYLCSKGYFRYADTYINSIFVNIDSWLNR